MGYHDAIDLDRVCHRMHCRLPRAGGVADPDGKSPFDMQLSFIRHRKHIGAVAQRMIAWGPQRIVIAHSRRYDENAVPELGRVFVGSYKSLLGPLLAHRQAPSRCGDRLSGLNHSIELFCW
jgi:hypothetical protein